MEAILVTSVKVKVGRGGYYDFVLTGQMDPGTNSTTIKSSLIDLRSGATLWSGSTIDRTLPNSFSTRGYFEKLYSNIAVEEPKKGEDK